MRLEDIKVDSTKIEQGEWIGDLPEMGALLLKARGNQSSDWKKLYRRLSDAVPRARKPGGQLQSADMEQINLKCLLECGIIDWNNLLDSDGVTQIPFSKDLLAKLLSDPDFIDFQSAAYTAVTRVGRNRAEGLTADAKN